MKYVSTRGQSPSLSASAAIAQGLAVDGGLYVPQTWPSLPKVGDLPFPEFAAEALKPFFADDPLQAKLPNLCAQAFNFPLVLKPLQAHTSLLELFHGPTHAFKDFGARFLALCLNEIPVANAQPRMVLVATSGDTGGAVAAAFSQCTQTPVVILFPQNGVSVRQEKQLTSWGAQVRAFAVQGSFDDCQAMVKHAFQSVKLQSKYNLLSANSINLARLLPQMSYFAYASEVYLQRNQRVAGLIVPSGNLGNAVAALWAQRVGFPISKVICAHNANQAVADFFKTQRWVPYPTRSTLANAMDVGNPSNFERMQAVWSPAQLRAQAGAYSVSDAEIRQTILRVKAEMGDVICPHTATAFSVREKFTSGDWIVVATAHPAKFENVVESLLNETVEIPRNLNEILHKPSQFSILAADPEQLEAVL